MRLKRFRNDNVTVDNEDEKDIFKTDWFKDFGNGYTPSVALKTNRKSIRGWTQKELAGRLWEFMSFTRIYTINCPKSS